VFALPLRNTVGKIRCVLWLASGDFFKPPRFIMRDIDSGIHIV
jgi:hypothetical protein